MKDVYIIDALRTPIGKYGGSLAGVRPDDMLAQIIKKLVEKNPTLNLDDIEEVIAGAANQSGEDNRNVARMSALLAGLPNSVSGNTVNKLCASGLQAIIDASRAIKNGDGQVYIAGGVESMSRAPFVIPKALSPYSRQAEMYDTTIGWRFTNPKLSEMYHPYSMGETAENVANQWNISRVDQDKFAKSSQEKYEKAHNAGLFKDEILPMTLSISKHEQVVFDKDEHPRNSSIEQLAKLSPAFKKDGTVTAANSSGVNDGAAALLLMSNDYAEQHGFKPMARIVAMASAGVDPSIMGIGPVPATIKALNRANLTIDDIDLFELNEAFASQSIACIKELNINENKVNINGGAIALGHPLGCSGARISTTLLYSLQREKKKYGLATMCVGVGQGVAIIYENLSL